MRRDISQVRINTDVKPRVPLWFQNGVDTPRTIKDETFRRVTHTLETARMGHRLMYALEDADMTLSQPDPTEHEWVAEFMSFRFPRRLDALLRLVSTLPFDTIETRRAIDDLKDRYKDVSPSLGDCKHIFQEWDDLGEYIAVILTPENGCTLATFQKFLNIGVYMETDRDVFVGFWENAGIEDSIQRGFDSLEYRDNGVSSHW
jgi:hypothetical protein